MFTVFEPKKRKIGNTAASANRQEVSARDDRSKKPREISAFNKALMSLNAPSQGVSRSSAKEVEIKRPSTKYFKKVDFDRQMLQNSIATFLDTVTIESNFDLRNMLFSHRTVQTDQQKDKECRTLLFALENEIYQSPQWIFPSLENKIVFKGMESAAANNLRKYIHRHEFWPIVDLELSGTDRSSQVQSSASRIKITVQQWQEALFATFDSFLCGSRDSFQVLGDTGVFSQANISSGASKAALSSLYLSLSFVYAKVNQPCCIVVGANKPFIRRLFALGAELYIISHTSSNPASSTSSGATQDLSAAGRLDRLKFGQNLFLSGKFNLSVVVNCILEQVFYPGLGSVSGMLLDSLPVIRSARYFCNAVPAFMTPRAVHGHHITSTASSNSSDADAVSADQRKVVLVGDAPVSVLSDLISILMKFALEQVTVSTAQQQSAVLAYPNMKLQVQAMLLGASGRSDITTAQQKQSLPAATSSSSSASTSNAASNENYNPMALLTLKSSTGKGIGSTSEGKKSMQDKPLSAEEEETLSTEEWLGRVRTLKLRYFILRPTYKNHRILGLLGYVPRVHRSEGMDVEEVLLEGDEVIQEIRWHSESPSPSAGGVVYVRSHPAPVQTTRRATPADAQQYYTTLPDPDPSTAVPVSSRDDSNEEKKLFENGITLQPLNAYSEFVDNRIM